MSDVCRCKYCGKFVERDTDNYLFEPGIEVGEEKTEYFCEKCWDVMLNSIAIKLRR